MSVGSDRRAVDAWFRDRGLPTLVPVRRWAGNLVVRTAPLVAFVGALTVGAAVVLNLYEWFYDRVGDNNLSDAADVVLALAMLGGIVLIPIVVTVLVRRWLRRVPAVRANVIAWSVVVIGFAAFVASSATTDDSSPFGHIAAGLLGVLAMFAVVWLGVGSVLGWTMRSALKNLGAVRHMASLALPVILLLVIFAFFSAEMWQLADNLSGARIVVLAVVMAVICCGVVIPASRHAVKDAQETLTTADRRQLLEATPLRHNNCDVPAVPLNRVQRFNVLLVMGVAQLTLGAIFAGLQAVILVAIGKVSLPNVTQHLWLTHDPVSIVIGESTMPITWNLWKTAVVLSLIAALSFIVSAVSDAQYREFFFDPMAADVRQALAVHDVYIAPGPTRQPTAPGDDPSGG